MPLTKVALRQVYKRTRQALSIDTRLQAEAAMNHHWCLWLKTQTQKLFIGSYLALPAECQTHTLHQACWSARHAVYIPLISQLGQFARLTPNTELVKTAIGILEPVAEPIVSVDALDVLLLPLLSIDKHGYRLGYGGGFYDRLLTVNPPLLIGVGYHAQLSTALPHDSWDIPLDGFLSETGWLHFKRKAPSKRMTSPFK